MKIWRYGKWQGSFANKNYPLIFEEPIASDFRYKKHIRGTCGSIMDKIAEGFGRGSRLEFINSLTFSKRESEELKSQLYRGFDLHYFSDQLFNELYYETDLLVKNPDYL